MFKKREKLYLAKLLCIVGLSALIAFEMLTALLGSNDLGTNTPGETQGPLSLIGSPALLHQIPLVWVVSLLAVAFFVIATLVSHARKLATRLEAANHTAMTDHVTGVGNRAALAVFKNATAFHEATKAGAFAVICLDLDDFKKLNDDHGHLAGDRALQITAMRIKSSLPDAECVFRMGGDEFVCIILDPDPAKVARDALSRLNAAFNTPMDLGGLSKVVTPSIGVAVANRGESWEDVFRRSDDAMYRAKRRDLLRAV